MSRDVFHFLGERWKKIPEALQRTRQTRDPPHATINRLCAPSSELAIEERWYPATNRHCAHVAGVRANNRCKLARTPYINYPRSAAL